MSSHSEPLVETLTAEIRVLQVGSRPATLSAARQLDHVDPADIKPFGRVRIDPKPPGRPGMRAELGRRAQGPAPDRAAVPGLRPRGNSLRPWRDHSVALHGIIPWYYDGSQAGPVAG
jgi:hypothetical protein